MNITAEEKLMYRVMKAIYNSGIPVSFKGSMVLKICLLEAGYSDEIRHTVDIDANWNSSTPPTIRQMTQSLQKAIDLCDTSLKINAFRQYGEGRSAGFEIRNTDSDEVLFTMDIDVNRPQPVTKLYEVEDIRFCGVAPVQMIADKICVLSTDRVFRRMKDVVDLYYISKVFSFNKDEILQTLKNNGRKLDMFNGFLHCTDELRHSYEKFRFEGGVSKPSFDVMYNAVKTFIGDVLLQEQNGDNEC